MATVLSTKRSLDLPNNTPQHPPLKRRKLNTNQPNSVSNPKSQTYTPQSPSPSPPLILQHIDIEIELDHTYNSDDSYPSPSPPWGRSPSPPPSQYFHKPSKKKSRWDDMSAQAKTFSKKPKNNANSLLTAGVNSLIHSINLQQTKQSRIEPLLLDEYGNPLNGNDGIEEDFDAQFIIESDSDNSEQFFDESITMKPAMKSRKSKAFQFIEQGTYTRIANELRFKELSYDNMKGSRLRMDKLANVDDEGLEWLDIVPNIEWWDAVLHCDKGKYEGYHSKIKHEMITDLIENPRILRPELLIKKDKEISGNNNEWILTKKERKKMKRILKKEQHELISDEIRLGLREAPEPRLKLSNIIAVLGTNAIKDPTAAESIVRAQMWKRKVKHELHNATNQLNPKERREKKRKKLCEDTSAEVFVSLFAIHGNNGENYKLNKAKVVLNAQQRNLTGSLVEFDEGLEAYAGVSMVIVEGGPKGISKYNGLLMRRIKWNSDESVGVLKGDSKEGVKSGMTNEECFCEKVWQGVVAKRNFQVFHQKKIKHESDLKRFLKMHNVSSYWDMVKNSRNVTSNV